VQGDETNIFVFYGWLWDKGFLWPALGQRILVSMACLERTEGSRRRQKVLLLKAASETQNALFWNIVF
jgi:hypothetical protein